MLNVTQVRFLLSPDKDFQRVGAVSGINYMESFAGYKKMFYKDPDSFPKEAAQFQTIIEEFSKAVFGTVPASQSSKGHIDTGDYESELEEFNNLPSDDDVEVARTDIDEAPPPPPLPRQSDSHVPEPALPPLQQPPVSVSVTSHISHTAAGSSLVSHVVNSNVVLPPSEQEVEEDPLPNPKKKGRPPAKKRVAKPLTKSGVTAEVSPVVKSTKAPAKPPQRTPLCLDDSELESSFPTTSSTTRCLHRTISFLLLRDNIFLGFLCSFRVVDRSGEFPEAAYRTEILALSHALMGLAREASI